MRQLKTTRSALLRQILASALTSATAVTAAAQEPYEIRITVTDPEGRRLDARAEILPPGTGIVSTSSTGLCVRTGADNALIRLVVTAEGFQPHATDPLDITGGAAREIVVTLVRPFSESLTVQGRAASLVGVAESASSGMVGAADLSARPLIRASDIIEAVPGVAMTQHSSGGHAPIILLRGYNLDHGTDFATSLEGAPMNMPSHAHAQGYTDINFLIEDLVRRIDFQKGPYASRTGNFGTAGAANIELHDVVDESFVRVESGGHGFLRLLGVTSLSRGDRRVLFAGEGSHDNGPSDVPDDFRRVKAVVRYSSGSPDRHVGITASSYVASWNATDGYPRRALERGYVSRYGTLDASDGGRSQQHLLVATRRIARTTGLVDLGAYVRYYDLDLFSNLTFWTVSSDDADQIWQADRRVVSGGHAAFSRFFSGGAGPAEIAGGLQARHDAARVQLRNTRARSPLDKTNDAGQLVPRQVYDNTIAETALSPYIETRLQPLSWLRVFAGARLDAIRMGVTSDRTANSGTRWSAMASPKGSVAFGPWHGTEFYANGGFGFHSNHAAGVMQRVDPATGLPLLPDGTPVRGSPPLVRMRGAETGVRTLILGHVQSSLALWLIDSDSELFYTPEDGVTSPERPGRRHGAEWLNFVQLRPWLSVDLDAAWSTARYRVDPHGVGRIVPDAASAVVGGGVTVSSSRMAVGLRARYVGERPLLPSGAEVVEGSFVVNGQIEFRVSSRLRVALQAFNVLNRRYEDTAYYYATRLRDPRTDQLEPRAFGDHVTHPAQPRTVRIGLRIGL